MTSLPCSALLWNTRNIILTNLHDVYIESIEKKATKPPVMIYLNIVEPILLKELNSIGKVCNKSFLIHLWWTASDFISSYRWRCSMCLLLGIPRALAKVSVSKEGSRDITAPWIPLPWRLSANSWWGEKTLVFCLYSHSNFNYHTHINFDAVSYHSLSIWEQWAALKRPVSHSRPSISTSWILEGILATSK